MDALGFFKFFADVIAWPLVALGIPLCASIRAIETSSKFHMRKLVMYWTLFSLVSLVEVTFEQLIQWVPHWPYIKLIAICYLVIPQFNGSCYVYQWLIQPYLSVNLRLLLSELFKPNEEPKIQTSLAAVDKCIKGAGSESLTNVIPNTPNLAELNRDVEEVEAVENSEKKEVAATELSNCEEPYPVPKDIKAVDPKVNNVASPANWVKPSELDVGQTEWTTVTATEVKQMIFPPAEEVVKVRPAYRNVQKEWTCPVCLITLQSEATLNSHLQGKKHKNKCEELKAQKSSPKITVPASSTPVEIKRAPSADAPKPQETDSSSGAFKPNLTNQEPTKAAPSPSPSPRQNITRKAETQGSSSDEQQFKQKNLKNGAPAAFEAKEENFRWWCSICNVRCPGKIDMASHLKGARHSNNVQAFINSLDTNVGGPEMLLQENSRVWCSICNVQCPGKIAMVAHLNGARHSNRVQAIISSVGSS